MKKILFLIFAVTFTFTACRSYKLTTDTHIRSSIDSSKIIRSGSQRVEIFQKDSLKQIRRDSSSVRQISSADRESEIKESFTPFVTPSGLVVPILKDRVTKSREHAQSDNSSTLVTENNILQTKLSAAIIARDSLSKELKLAKGFAEDGKRTEKKQPPNYFLWALVVGIAIITGVGFILKS